MHSNANNPNVPPRAWQCPACHLRLWIVLLAVLAADLLSKRVAFDTLGWPGEPETVTKTVLPGVLDFQTQLNDGAALGLLPGYRLLLLAVGLLALAVFMVIFARSLTNQWFMHLGVGLVLAGALGNIYDRMVHEKVRDFISITVQWHDRLIYPYIFNIADIALIVGVIMIMASSMRSSHGPTPAK